MILVQFIHICDGPDHHTEVGHDVVEIWPADAIARVAEPKLQPGWHLTDDGKMLCPTCAGREPAQANA